MFTQNQITITQVSNGWMVILPFQPPMLVGMPMDEEYAIRRQARIMKDEIQGDDVLKQIQEQSMERPQYKETPLSEIKEKHISVFKTFDEVLEFLKSKI